MLDKDTVIKGLTELANSKAMQPDYKKLFKSAIELLNGKAVNPNIYDHECYCGACGQCIGGIGDADYCQGCGTPVNWDDD